MSAPTMNIGMVPSRSRYELACMELGSEKAVRDAFHSDAVFERIYESHKRQKRNLRTLEEALGPSVFYDRSTLPAIINQYDALVFCGGDNHFTYCAQQVMRHSPDTYVAGLVLDEGHSAGALLSYDTGSFLEDYDVLREGNFALQEWSTLEGELADGTRLMPAIGDYLVSEYARQYMSRNHARIDGEQALPEKSSGILVATGAGTQPGSWFNSLYSIYTGEEATFPCTERQAMLLATENPEKPIARLEAGSTLTIDSYNDTYGVIVPDSHADHSVSFPMGQRAYIRLSGSSLKVIGGDGNADAF